MDGHQGLEAKAVSGPFSKEGVIGIDEFMQ